MCYYYKCVIMHVKIAICFISIFMVSKSDSSDHAASDQNCLVLTLHWAKISDTVRHMISHPKCWLEHWPATSLSSHVHSLFYWKNKALFTCIWAVPSGYSFCKASKMRDIRDMVISYLLVFSQRFSRKFSLLSSSVVVSDIAARICVGTWTQCQCDDRNVDTVSVWWPTCTFVNPSL